MNVFMLSLFFLQIVLDYNDQKNIPYVREWIESFNEDCPRVRSDFYYPYLFFLKKRERNNQVFPVTKLLAQHDPWSAMVCTLRFRDTVKGEDGNQILHLPAVLPKVPGRLYFLFGKPIEMKGMDNVLRDRKSANDVYLHIKSEVENTMSYLKRKREEDPYRSITQRTLYQATWGASAQVPTFEP